MLDLTGRTMMTMSNWVITILLRTPPERNGEFPRVPRHTNDNLRRPVASNFPTANFKESVRWTKDGIEIPSPIAGADDGRTENSLCPLPSFQSVLDMSEKRGNGRRIIR